MKVFWDTNVFIYFVERHPGYYPVVLTSYSDSRARGDQLFTSALTLGEVLAQPVRLGRQDLVDQYTTLISDTHVFTVLSFDEHAARTYAKIRAETSLRQPDAMQIASASTAGIDLFLSNDQRWLALGTCNGINIIGLDQGEH